MTLWSTRYSEAAPWPCLALMPLLVPGASSGACPTLQLRDEELRLVAGGRGLTILCFCQPHPGRRFRCVLSLGGPVEVRLGSPHF